MDVSDLPESRQFISALKERLKDRFKQIDIWITTYPIEVVKRHEHARQMSKTANS